MNGARSIMLLLLIANLVAALAIILPGVPKSLSIGPYFEFCTLEKQLTDAGVIRVDEDAKKRSYETDPAWAAPPTLAQHVFRMTSHSVNTLSLWLIGALLGNTLLAAAALCAFRRSELIGRG